MAAVSRIVLPELLDELAPSDPRAARSRRDLRRVHRVMGSLSVLQLAIMRLRLATPPRRILELGAGDGSLMLRLANAMTPYWGEVSLTMLDRHDVVSAQTRAGYEALGWQLRVLQADALEWAVEGAPQHFDLCITCLFLHHFDDTNLPVLLRGIAAHADALVACEPARSRLARAGSALIGLLGTNHVTREDAVKSVAAGFNARELTAVWPSADGAWNCEEHAAMPFLHCFTAVLKSVCRGYASTDS